MTQTESGKNILVSVIFCIPLCLSHMGLRKDVKLKSPKICNICHVSSEYWDALLQKQSCEMEGALKAIIGGIVM